MRQGAKDSRNPISQPIKKPSDRGNNFSHGMGFKFTSGAWCQATKSNRDQAFERTCEQGRLIPRSQDLALPRNLGVSVSRDVANFHDLGHWFHRGLGRKTPSQLDFEAHRELGVLASRFQCGLRSGSQWNLKPFVMGFKRSWNTFSKMSSDQLNLVAWPSR